MPQNITISEPRKTILSPILEHFENREVLDDLIRHDAKVRAALNDSARHLGRKEIRDQMEKLTGNPISIHMLNAWLAPGKSRALFPVIYIEAFCKATGCDALKRLLLGPELLEMLELGERAAAILNDRARRQVLKIPGDVHLVGEKRNGNGTCAR
jgi:hypothetical protein